MKKFRCIKKGNGFERWLCLTCKHTIAISKHNRNEKKILCSYCGTEELRDKETDQ